MSEKTKLLAGAYYIENPSFAQIDEIFKYIGDDGNVITQDLDKNQINYLEKLIQQFKESYNKIQNRKLTNYTKEDFEKIIDKFYEEFNLYGTDKPNVTIVKHFPHPFENCDYKAMNFNAI